MINFFRKKRKKMAGDNKALKYTRYAIGEIVLVVIGILIALQINTWNEDRKRENLANAYIEKLINDLALDTINMNNLLIKGQKNIKTADDYFNYFNEGTHSLDALIDSSLNIRIHFVRYLPVDYTFNDMQSSGNIDLLNEKQRRALMELSNEQEFTQIIIEKVISSIIQETHEYEKYLNSTFHTKISIQQDEKLKIQGLLHKNNAISWGRALSENAEWRIGVMKEKTKEIIKLLQEN